MTVSTLIGVNTQAQPSEVWALLSCFKPNWKTNPKNSCEFTTEIETSPGGDETRRGLSEKAPIAQTVEVNTRNREQARLAQMVALRTGSAKTTMPLKSDTTFLTEAASTGSTTIMCDTRFRRIGAGMRVAIVPFEDPLNSKAFDLRTVVSKTDTSITLDDEPSQNFTAGSYVIPIMECQISLRTRGSMVNRFVSKITLASVEVVGPTQLPAIASVGSEPTGYQIVRDLPVFDFPINLDEVDWEISRPGSINAAGIGSSATIHGTRPVFSYELPFLVKGREEAWRLLSFLHSRGGRLFPFWWRNEHAEYNVTAVAFGGTSITVDAVGSALDWSYVKHLAITLQNGDYLIADVESVLRTGSSDAVTFADALGTVTLSDIRSVNVCLLCRCDTDEVSEEWHSLDVLETSVPILELDSERVIEIEHIEEPETEAATVPFRPALCRVPIPEEVYYTAIYNPGGPSTVPRFAYIETDTNTEADLSHLIERASSNWDPSVWLFYLPNFDGSGIYLCGNARIAGESGDYARVLRYGQQGMSEVGSNLAEVTANADNPSEDEGIINCVGVFEGVLHLAVTHPAGGFSRDVSVWKLDPIANSWSRYLTIFGINSDANNFRVIQPEGGSPRFFLSCGATADGALFEILGFDSYLDMEISDIGVHRDILPNDGSGEIVVVGFFTPASGFNGHVSRHDGFVALSPVFTNYSGGYYRNAGTSSPSSPLLWTASGRGLEKAMLYNGKYFACGAAAPFDPNWNVNLISWEKPATLPDFTDSFWGLINGGNAWKHMKNWNQASPSSHTEADRYVDMCLKDGAIFCVGSISRVNSTSINCRGMSKLPDATDDDSVMVPVIGTGGLVQTMVSCCAYAVDSSRVRNTNDPGHPFSLNSSGY